MKAIAILCWLVGCCAVHAAEMDYPELQVVPRASDRLKMEAEKDHGFRLVSWPILVPALGAIATGAFNANSSDLGRDPFKASAWIPGTVGVTWVGISAILALTWSPYRSSWADLKETSGSSKRDQLTRERLAEEGLRAASRTAWILGITASVTLAASNVIGATQASSPASSMVGMASAVLSLLPIVFPMRQVGVYDQHLEYKKKIYAPIASFRLVPEPVTGILSPGWSVAFSF